MTVQTTLSTMPFTIEQLQTELFRLASIGALTLNHSLGHPDDDISRPDFLGTCVHRGVVVDRGPVNPDDPTGPRNLAVAPGTIPVLTWVLESLRAKDEGSVTD